MTSFPKNVQDVIAALREAQEPSRELDGIIAMAVKAPCTDPNGPWPPRYTSDLTAARSLIPPGLYWILCEGKTRPREPLGGCRIFEPRPGAMSSIAEEEHENVCIACCIAALEVYAMDPLNQTFTEKRAPLPSPMQDVGAYYYSLEHGILPVHLNPVGSWAIDSRSDIEARGGIGTYSDGAIREGMRLAGVYYSAEHDVFRDRNGRDMGEAFRAFWSARSPAFPQSMDEVTPRAAVSQDNCA